MKKKVLVALAVVLVLIAGALGFLALNANSIVAKFKPEMERIASQALGNTVTLGEMKLAFFPALSLVSEGVVVGSEKSSDLSLRRLVFSVGLTQLLSGNVAISELKLVEPAIVIRKEQDRVVVGGMKPKASPAAATATASAQPKQATSALPAWLTLNLDQFSLEKGQLSFIDTAANKTISLSEITVNSGLRVAAPSVTLPKVKFSALIEKILSAAFEAQDLNYNLDSGQLQIPQASLSVLDGSLGVQGEYNLNSKAGAFDISPQKSLSLAKLSSLASLVPALSQFKFEGGVAPAFKAKLVDGGPSASGKITLEKVGVTKDALTLSDLNGTIELKVIPPEVQSKSSDLSLNFGGQPVKLQFISAFNQSLSLAPLSLQLAGGEIKGDLKLVPSSGEFATDFQLSTLQISQLLLMAKPDMAQKLSGVIHGVRGQLSGSLGADLMPSLKGNVSADLRDTFVPGVNLAAKVLASVKDLPFLSGALISSVPPQLMQELNSESTVIKSLTGNFRIADSALNTTDLNLLSNIFSLSGSGRVGFDSSINLNATIFFSKAFSEALVTKVKELKNILDQEGRLVIPLKIEGKGSSIVVLPDLGKLLRLGAQNALKDRAGDLLNKALGGKGSSKGGGLGGLLGF